MTTHAVACDYEEGMRFEVEVDGFRIAVDAAPEHGGHGGGPKPKPLLLASLAGCTGMDVVYILKQKMHEPLQHFAVRVEGDLTETQPAVYDKVRVVYEFKKSDGLAADKVERAVTLSQEKYCGVSAMLKKACDLSWEIRYLD
jgi:putative redox protein